MNIGTVSSGTMREEDLIPAFVAHLEGQENLTPEHRALAGEINSALESDEYFASEAASYDLEDLFDALDAYAPLYFYFGSHPGDGADYGFWLPEDFPGEFDGLIVADVAEIPADYTGEALVTNAHGDAVTLYSVNEGSPSRIWDLA